VKKCKEAKIAVTVLTSPSTYPVNDDLKSYVPILGDMAKEAEQVAKEEGVLFADCYTPFKKWLDDGKGNFNLGRRASIPTRAAIA